MMKEQCEKCICEGRTYTTTEAMRSDMGWSGSDMGWKSITKAALRLAQDQTEENG